MTGVGHYHGSRWLISRCVARVNRSQPLSSPCSRKLHTDSRNRLTEFWIPSAKGAHSAADKNDAHSLLLRAGFLRQAYSGIFHLLPLGLRVQDKVEKLIDRHMRKLGATKLSLSSLSSEDLWAQSGRLENAELLKLKSRTAQKFILAPTHEEELTRLVKKSISSYKELPIRLYQVSRKYRDELRPRQGLLRTREFLMKDLYTFDVDTETALETYRDVKLAYDDIFTELKLPYIVAEADSGNMGGSLSHEFHFISRFGEDNLVSCNSCSYVSNEELAQRGENSLHFSSDEGIETWTGVSKDGFTLVEAYFPKHSPGELTNEINPHVLQKVTPPLEFGVDNPFKVWKLKQEKFKEENGWLGGGVFHVLRVFDQRLLDPSTLQFSEHLREALPSGEVIAFLERSTTVKDVVRNKDNDELLDLVRIRIGDTCPRCNTGKLNMQTAVELGHTFHLGTRYSEPLGANVYVPGNLHETPLEMGCHGIGVSRMIGAVASILADEKGLNWPRVMAPFEVVVVPAAGMEDDAIQLYDALMRPEVVDNAMNGTDTVIDDRVESLPTRLTDADLIGYPVIVVLGKRWQAEQRCEVQCRTLGVKELVPKAEAVGFIKGLLDKL